MVIKMKISWLKYEKDKKSFRLPQALGFDVFLLNDLDKTDETMKKLIQQHYDTIVLSNEVAGFSEDIIKKYQKDKEIKIVISLDKD
jgi:vacuolar-type H+-ATPase subunit F/Vma7